MRIDSFRHLYVAELQELLSVQEQLQQCWPALEQEASHPDLVAALRDCAQETDRQRRFLAELLADHNAGPRAQPEQPIDALVEATRQLMARLHKPEVRDAGMIASARKLLHYAIAACSSAAAFAVPLGHGGERQQLQALSDASETLDRRLADIADRIIGAEAGDKAA